MPRWASTASPSSRLHHRYLPRRRTPSTRRPARIGREVGAAGEMAADGPVGEHLDCGDATADDVGGEAAAHHLHLGKLRHVSFPSGGSRSGSTAASTASSIRPQTAVGLRGSLLLGFLLRPPRTAAVVVPGEHDGGGEQLRVIGSFLGDPVLGHAESEGRGELLQRGLPVQAGAEGRRRRDELGEQPVNDAAGRLEAVLQVDRPEDGLHRVGQDRRLVATAGQFLAPSHPDAASRPRSPGRRRPARAC